MVPYMLAFQKMPLSKLNKTLLITGSSRGIGLATANKFLDEGWLVLGTSTTQNKILSHKNYRHYILNLADQKSINACSEIIKKDNKQIDVLINCAGIGIEPEVNQMDITALRKTLEVNLIGTISFTENILPIITGTGHVVAVSTMMASLSEFDNGIMPAYRISKTGLNMYVKTLADRLKGITVSAFDPGWVKTDMGGADAPRDPKIPAQELFQLATAPHPTGNFWYEDKIRSW